MRKFLSKATQLTADDFTSVTSCLVLAPHPDDESLGCGGLLSLLRELGKDVFVIFITDGSMSHPNSQQYPADKLAALRREEAIQALSVLQVPEANVFFLNKKDGALPATGENGFEKNAGQLYLLLTLLHPDLVLVPYEKDTHRDHRAVWQMLMYKHGSTEINYRILEYLVWLLARGEEEDMPEEKAVYFVDISQHQPRKQQAIRRHKSQTTRLIKDDPEGFILSDNVLQHFITDKEYYIDRQL